MNHNFKGRDFINLHDMNPDEWRYLLDLAATLKAEKKAGVDQGAVAFVTTVIKIFLYLVIILMILNGLGVRTSSLLTLLGSIGLAIVLGLKDNLSNVASGIIIMVLKPFNVGDHII